MANPQVENGYTRIANEIMEALMRTNLSAYQSRILWAIWRKTYGWNKTTDWISNSQLVEMTGIRKQHVSRTVKELIDRNIVTKSGYKKAFNKNYTQWRELPRQVTVTSLGYKVTSTGYKSNLVRGTQKKKETNTKETIHKESFYKFWSVYPYKVNKQKALEAWLKLKPAPALVQGIISFVEKASQSVEWTKDGGKFRPYASTFLNNHRWEDELTFKTDWRE